MATQNGILYPANQPNHLTHSDINLEALCACDAEGLQVCGTLTTESDSVLVFGDILPYCLVQM